MNSIDLLWQIFKARYSLNAMRESLSKDYRLALVGDSRNLERLRGWMGCPEIGSGRREPLLLVEAPLPEGSVKPLEEADAAIYHVGERYPDPDWLRRQAESIPVGVPCLWIWEGIGEAEAAERDSTLPRLYRVDPVHPERRLARLMLSTFPDLGLRLARDFPRARLECARRTTARVASRNALLAAASSMTSTLPVVGSLLSLLAVSAETLVITASQLHLCLLVGALYGRPIDFFDRVGELWPVVGGAFGWRALSRELVGLVPFAGPAMKATVAYGGTWMVGEASRLFYEHGQTFTSRQIAEEARRRALEETRRYREIPRADRDSEPGDD